MNQMKRSAADETSRRKVTPKCIKTIVTSIKIIYSLSITFVNAENNLYFSIWKYAGKSHTERDVMFYVEKF